MQSVSPISDFLVAVAGRGRSILGISADKDGMSSAESMVELCKQLLSSKGNASGLALAHEILSSYQNLDDGQKTDFFLSLRSEFSSDLEKVRTAATTFLKDGNANSLAGLTASVEPPRRQLISRLNQAPNATLQLIQMREDLLDRLRSKPELREIDTDFSVVFSSWFNGGFLELHSLDWSSPADMLENIMKYEAVHGMAGWDDLRDRIAPPDRLIYSFFHPRLGNEPLIFIEVALMPAMPAKIGDILSPDGEPTSPSDARTAVFYSISNCQKGLRGIPLGSFLIKQVVEELKSTYPKLKEFVTLSPVPGFAKWLDSWVDGANEESFGGDPEMLQSLKSKDWVGVESKESELTEMVSALAAGYLLREKDPRGRPTNSVAKFHLGNGASLDRINWPADMSKNGMGSSLGLMVNYKYNLDQIEQNHEDFVQTGEVHVSTNVAKVEKMFDRYVG